MIDPTGCAWFGTKYTVFELCPTTCLFFPVNRPKRRPAVQEGSVHSRLAHDARGEGQAAQRGGRARGCRPRELFRRARAHLAPATGP